MALETVRSAQPGPGVWDVTDLDGRLAVRDGRLFISGASAAWDRTMLALETPFTRHKGRYLEFEWTPTTNTADAAVAWHLAADAAVGTQEAGLRFAASGEVWAIDGPNVTVNVRYPYSAGTSYVGRIYDGGPPTLKAGGSNDWFMYVRPASQETWSLLWRKPASAASLTEVYAGLNNRSAAGSMGYVRIRESTLLLVQHFSARPVPGGFACALGDAVVEVLAACPDSFPVAGGPALLFRYADADNCWRLQMDLAGGKLSLVKRAAGVETVVGSRSVAWTPSRPYLLRAVCLGAAVTTWLGRVPGPWTADSFNDTAEIIGTGAGAFDYLNLRADTGGELLW